jgi:hypothetical protein
MDPELGARIDALNLVIGMLIGAVLLAACWIMQTPIEPARPKADFCPLHRKAVADCRDQHKP